MIIAKGYSLKCIFIYSQKSKKNDPFKNYVVKRVYCPSCSKIQIKKVYTNYYYTKYKCWNKNCEEKNEPFALINNYLNEEKEFNGKCEKCDQELYREFIEIDDSNCKLIFKCVNDDCDESNFQGQFLELYCNTQFLLHISLDNLKSILYYTRLL